MGMEALEREDKLRFWVHSLPVTSMIFEKVSGRKPLLVHGPCGARGRGFGPH
jgi:hypothetical protein